MVENVVFLSPKMGMFQVRFGNFGCFMLRMGFSHVLLKIVMYLKIEHALLGLSVFVLAFMDEDRSLFYNFFGEKT
jgi:hypothetical protein